MLNKLVSRDKVIAVVAAALLTSAVTSATVATVRRLISMAPLTLPWGRTGCASQSMVGINLEVLRCCASDRVGGHAILG